MNTVNCTNLHVMDAVVMLYLRTAVMVSIYTYIYDIHTFNRCSSKALQPMNVSIAANLNSSIYSCK